MNAETPCHARLSHKQPSIAFAALVMVVILPIIVVAANAMPTGGQVDFALDAIDQGDVDVFMYHPPFALSFIKMLTA